MRITHRSHQALASLILLGRQNPGSRARLQDLAVATAVPSKVLESLLADLRRAGLIESRRGPDGGHSLARPLAAIRLVDVVEAADGPLAIDRSAAGGADDGLWGLRALSDEWVDGLRATLAATTLEDVALRVDSGSGKVDFSI